MSAGVQRRALVVEDSAELRQIVTRLLEGKGFAVEAAEDGESALQLARDRRPDMVVLDIGLPGIDGVEVCRRLRTFSDAYVVMLTSRADEVDKLIGLSIGADDYMTKPFSARELGARIDVLMRRPRAPAASGEEVRTVGEVEIDLLAHQVRVRGELVDLTRTEFQLLEALSERTRVTLTRGQLLDRVWGPNWFGDDHVVDVHMSNLRRKIEADPSAPVYVKTVRGVGYRMETGA